MALFWSRVFIVVTVPVVIPLVFLFDLTKEIGAAFRYAWLSLCWEMEDVRRYWHQGLHQNERTEGLDGKNATD